jgi:propanol-preferring alcohol dehydrogenase
MRAMVLKHPKRPLELQELPIPRPGPGQVLIEISACGVCRTDLHIVDGELPHPHLPLIPGHQIVGKVKELGPGASRFSIGERIGVPWLGKTCGECEYCQTERENLCNKAKFTGYDLNGGFAEFCVADTAYCFPLPQNYSDTAIAPLLCAGFVGYRAWKMTENAQKVGFYGFGASAHILTQIAVHEGKEIYAFTRENDFEAQKLARSLGAKWAGDSNETPPTPLDAAILFAPIGALVPIALRAVKKGGRVICAGIHMSDIPSFPYDILWGERQLRSVANLTRKDGEEFLALASKVPIKTQTTIYPLEKAGQALDDLRSGHITGAAVIEMSS